MKSPTRTGAAGLCLLMTTQVLALETEYGSIDADFRLRHEAVEQRNALADASANTLHARMGFASKAWQGLSFYVQGEAISALGDEDYNSGPGGNGNTGFSVVPDPEAEEINQAWLGYAALPDTIIKLGRQRIIYDNARFVGNVGWRQNEQTYDGITFVNQGVANTLINYAYLAQVNDIFAQEKNLDRAHLLNLSHEYRPGSKLGAFAYYLDYAPGDGADSTTLGLRGDGQLFKAATVTGRYRLELARQTDYADSAISYELDYRLAELALIWPSFSLKGGIETLEGDGVHAVQTPLATLHAFNGWADQFLNTPAVGLVDRYVGLGGKLQSVDLALVYHDFVSDIDGIDHGSEWDVSAGFAAAQGWSLLIKYANYQAAATSVDTQKLWLQAAYAFN